jgi:hypothetical protein
MTTDLPIPFAILFCIVALSGCSTTLPIESPICVPSRPILQDLSVEQQLKMRDVDNGELLLVVSTNDATLKSHVKVLEGLIQIHDEPLGGCD